jgi:hypothetical protein
MAGQRNPHWLSMPAGVIRRKEENMTTAKVHVSPTTLLFHFEQGLISQFGDGGAGS